MQLVPKNRNGIIQSSIIQYIMTGKYCIEKVSYSIMKQCRIANPMTEYWIEKYIMPHLKQSKTSPLASCWIVSTLVRHMFLSMQDFVSHGIALILDYFLKLQEKIPDNCLNSYVKGFLADCKYFNRVDSFWLSFLGSKIAQYCSLW